MSTLLLLHVSGGGPYWPSAQVRALHRLHYQFCYSFVEISSGSWSSAFTTGGITNARHRPLFSPLVYDFMSKRFPHDASMVSPPSPAVRAYVNYIDLCSFDGFLHHPLVPFTSGL